MGGFSPEAHGISSGNIKQYLQSLEDGGLSMHSMILERGGEILFEQYWEPFHIDSCHRLYSVSKSFVGIAIGFLEQEGYIALDDTILKYFPEEKQYVEDEMMKRQTIRNMLMMSTSRCGRYWFDDKPTDRVHYYFSSVEKQNQKPTTVFEYDSDASFVLGALVERLTGQNFIDFLRKRLFDKIGISSEIKCLKCPGGHSWTDSAIICTSRDLLKFARFVMNQGCVGEEQIIDKEFMKEATSKLIDNNDWGFHTHNTEGYGYQIWRTYDNSFAFMGMGCQFAICVPEKDLIFVCTADNQGITYAPKLIFDGFFQYIASPAIDVAERKFNEIEELEQYCSKLKLAVAVGKKDTEFSKEIDGVRYKMDSNPMGIKWFELHLKKEENTFIYENAQGVKTLSFGMCENVFSLFPEEGYSREVGTVSAIGNYYKCAASAAWIEEKKLSLKVQVIDEYFGRLNITLGFHDDMVGISMRKAAEDFMKEYEGYGIGYRIRTN